MIRRYLHGRVPVVLLLAGIYNWVGDAPRLVGILFKSVLAGVLAVALALLLCFILGLVGLIVYALFSKPAPEGGQAIGLDVISLLRRYAAMAILMGVAIFAVGFIWGFRHFSGAGR